MTLLELRAERLELCVRIKRLDRQIGAASRERGISWRRLFAQRLALWNRLNAVERRMVHHYARAGRET
jgi:hypothetical protein